MNKLISKAKLAATSSNSSDELQKNQVKLSLNIEKLRTNKNTEQRFS
jgi:hypothetical protein